MTSDRPTFCGVPISTDCRIPPSVMGVVAPPGVILYPGPHECAEDDPCDARTAELEEQP